MRDRVSSVKASEGFESKYKRPFSVSQKFIPCGHVYGATRPNPFRNTAKSSGRQASRRCNEEWKENNARTENEYTLSSVITRAIDKFVRFDR